MPGTVIIPKDGKPDDRNASFVFHLLRTVAPTGHDPHGDPPTLATGTTPTDECRAWRRTRRMPAG
jgi:hypothetical protein